MCSREAIWMVKMPKDYEAGPLPQMHPRHLPMEEAHIEMTKALISIRKKYDLTVSEYLYLLSDEMNVTLGYCIRAERKMDEDGTEES